MKTLSVVLFGAVLISTAAASARDVAHPAMLTLSPRPDWFVTRDKMRGLLGWAVGTAGDVNGDGFADVIIGAPTQFEDGRVYVYFGSAAGLTKGSVPRWSMGEGESVRFGGGNGRRCERRRL